MPRTIDRETLIDLLNLTAYQSRRSLQLEQLGIEDKGDASETLLDLILDALGAPPNDFKNRGQEFDRNELYEAFYNDFILENRYKNTAHLLEALEQASAQAAQQWQFNISHFQQLKTG